MNLRKTRGRVLTVALFTACTVLTVGCDTTVNETGENAKNFGVSVGKTAKDAGMRVGEAFNKTFRSKKGKDEPSAEIKKAKPSDTGTTKE